MQKTVLKVSEIKNNPNNPRLIKDDKFKKLVKSIQEFPEMLDAREVVVNKDHIILGGNMRFKAAKEAGIKEVPVKIVDWDEEKQRQFVIKDNVSGGEWDWDMLANEFDQDELDEWGLDTPDNWEEDKEVEEDEAPEVDESEPPKSKLGEVYRVGQHRVICGSATSMDDMENLFGEQRADLYLSDPPYNVAYEGKTKDALKIQNDSMNNEEFGQFLTDSFVTADSFIKKGASFYIWHADSEGYNFRKAVFNAQWLLKQTLVWNKNTMVMGRQDYQWKHEPCLYGWKSGASHAWYSDRKQTTIINFDKPSRNGEHPTMKPVGLMAYLIENSSKKDDIVLDNFLGSGSTLIACEQTGRICYGSELDPKYTDVVRKRYWKFVNDNNEEGWEENTPAIKE